ncbi:MAG TPA: YkvA family protein [Myxococcaceae bacterium]
MTEPPADRPGFARRTLAFIGDPAVAFWRKLLAAVAGMVAVLYAIIPFDLVPDIIPILGWLDDLGVMGLVSWYVMRQINKHAEARARLPPPPPPSLSR